MSASRVCGPQGEPNQYLEKFECMKCAEGCDKCYDSSPCVLVLNWVLRSILLALSVMIVSFLLVLVWFTVHYRNVKVSVTECLRKFD